MQPPPFFPVLPGQPDSTFIAPSLNTNDPRLTRRHELETSQQQQQQQQQPQQQRPRGQFYDVAPSANGVSSPHETEIETDADEAERVEDTILTQLRKQNDLLSVQLVNAGEGQGVVRVLLFCCGSFAFSLVLIPLVVRSSACNALYVVDFGATICAGNADGRSKYRHQFENIRNDLHLSFPP
jgi:hypothetical protein